MKVSFRKLICAAAAMSLFAVQAHAVTLNNGLSGNANFTVELGQAGSSSNMSYGGWSDQVFTWDMYVSISGVVTRLGDSTQWTTSGSLSNSFLSYESVAITGLRVDVLASLPSASNILETKYTINNTGPTTINNIKMYQYLDPDLAGTAGNDSASTTTVGGKTMMIASDPTTPATSIGLINGGTFSGLTFAGWEIGEYDTLIDSISGGSYNLSNSISHVGNPFDVTMALQYNIASIGSGRSETISTELVANPVPEPGTMVLLGAGLLGLAIFGKRRMNREA